jgi:hypothetical protein
MGWVDQRFDKDRGAKKRYASLATGAEVTSRLGIDETETGEIQSDRAGLSGLFQDPPEFPEPFLQELAFEQQPVAAGAGMPRDP